MLVFKGPASHSAPVVGTYPHSQPHLPSLPRPKHNGQPDHYMRTLIEYGWCVCVGGGARNIRPLSLACDCM